MVTSSAVGKDLGSGLWALGAVTAGVRCALKVETLKRGRDGLLSL